MPWFHCGPLKKKKNSWEGYEKNGYGQNGQGYGQGNGQDGQKNTLDKIQKEEH